MQWTKDVDEINRVFFDCFSHDSRKDNIEMKEELRNLFMTQLQNSQSTDKERIIRACWVFENTIGSYSRERFFEICHDEKLINKSLLTDLFLSVHTYARPYTFFSDDKMEEIFKNLDLPFTCVVVKRELQDLPDEIEIYRGLRDLPSDLDQCGYCWTLKKKIAEVFATGNGRIDGYIVSGVIKKSKIIGLVLARQEEEIIARSINVSDKKIEKFSAK